MKINLRLDKAVVLLGFACVAAAPGAFAGTWSGDPVSWKAAGDSLRASGSGFAFSSDAVGREVSVSARVTPSSCVNEEWSTLGVAVYADSQTFWHLALVKQPDAMGAKHSFELAMMYEGQWPVQGRLPCRENKVEGQWEYGKDCRLSLKMTPSGICGEVTDAATGKRLYRAAFAFNAPCADRGRPALHVTGHFAGTFADMAASVGQAVPSAPVAYPPYPKANAKPIAAAAGFFRLTEHDGRWTAVDPHGAPFTVLGVDHVQPWGMHCETLGYAPYGRHVKAAYPNLDDWRDETIGRLKAWGFNALGAGCDFGRLGHRGLVHTVFLSMGDRLCYADGDLWIRKSKRAPCTAFPNVFHPDFPAACDWTAQQKCTPGDPWLFGYFIDNELAWWGSGGLEEGMFDAAKALPKGHSAREALEAFVAGRAVTRELKLDFLRLVADRYFAVTTAAIRKADPNHLILGCRFAGLGGAHAAVWEAAAKSCDLVTFNIYPWADIDRNIVLDGKGGVPVKERFDELYARVKKPMIVTEWSFPALDTGRPCLHGAGQRFPTQAGRVAATELFAKTMLALPYFVGYDYFMWVDQPAPGMNRFFPEDSNYGLVQEDGTPHKGITEMFARLHAETERWKRAGLPPPRAYKEPPAVTERERFLAAATGDADAVRFVRTEKDWTLTNGTGLELHGRLTGGGGDMVADVRRDGRRYGSLGGLVELKGPDGSKWVDVREIRAVDFVREGACGSVRVTAAGAHGAARFELALRVTLAPGRADFAADLVSLRNTGTEPLSVAALYLRPFAEGKVSEKPQVPNLWKGKATGCWLWEDGRRYALESGDADVRVFRLWLNEHGGQHPDATFSVPGLETLPPGETYRPPRPLSARVMPAPAKP